jgi:hypothetical protein
MEDHPLDQRAGAAAALSTDSDAGAKDASRELARRLATPEGARTMRARQRAGTLRLPEPALQLPPEPSASAGAGIGAESREKGGPRPALDVAAGARGPDGAARRPRPIGIWQPRGESAELVFVRPEPLPLGDHFAARREIRPKRAQLPLRVCLFGESAAAGYLYAPHLTPATVLEGQLRAVAGDGAAEVVDLARTNETLGSLVATVESAVQIQPDVLVIFAGNNWNLLETPEVSPYAPSVAARQQFAEAWREDGPRGPVALAARRLRGIVETAFERVALVARAIGVPVVMVVPEVSLAGWESRQPVAWLTEAGEGRPDMPRAGKPDRPRSRHHSPIVAIPTIAAWYRLLARGRRHLERGAWAAAARTAEAMLDLDGGGNPTSWRLLARARMGAGDQRAAATAARAEIDAAAYPTLAFLGAPQATTLAQDLLRQAARRHCFACVDLPAVFALHTGSPLPGRRLFLDYCHLTAEGIEVAMAAVACEVLRLAGMEAGAGGIGLAGAAGELGWRELLRRLPPLRVPANVEALARLGAAVHGSHRLLAVGAKIPFLESWCDAALDVSPGIEAAMLDLIAARAAPLPAVLTPAQARNLASEHRLGLSHGWRWDHVDADAIEAIVASLERHGRPAARAEADALLIAHRGIRASGTDLLDPPYYLWEPLERFYPDVMSFEDLPRPATLRSPWPETALCLICGGDDDVTLEITARLPLPPSPTPGEPVRPAGGSSRRPAAAQDGFDDPGSRSRRDAAPARRRGTLRLLVNGTPAGALPLREAWSRPVIRVPRHLLRPGRNRLTLHWPAPATSANVALAAALARLDEGIAADLHPVFGELYSVVARPV